MYLCGIRPCVIEMGWVGPRKHQNMSQLPHVSNKTGMKLVAEAKLKDMGPGPFMLFWTCCNNFHSGCNAYFVGKKHAISDAIIGFGRTPGTFTCIKSNGFFRFEPAECPHVAWNVARCTCHFAPTSMPLFCQGLQRGWKQHANEAQLCIFQSMPKWPPT